MSRAKGETLSVDWLRAGQDDETATYMHSTSEGSDWFEDVCPIGRKNTADATIVYKKMNMHSSQRNVAIFMPITSTSLYRVGLAVDHSGQVRSSGSWGRRPPADLLEPR